jgi:hypothetical protein
MGEAEVRVPKDAIRHGCGAWWTGGERSHCGGCHLTFSSQTAFDRHRRRLRCVAPATAGLVARPVVWGAVWGLPGAFDDRFERMLERWDAEGGES